MSEKSTFTTRNVTTYLDVRLMRDAKHFEATEGKPACTYVSFVHKSKGGEDIFVDARIVRGAKLFAALKKGDNISISGELTFKKNDKGNVVGVMYDVAQLSTNVILKDRADDTTASAFD